MLWGGGYGVTQIPKGPENRWFDKWELHDIFDSDKLDKDNKIQELLADMFGSEQKNDKQ